MYAIVEIAGQQFKVQKDQRVFVNRLQNTEGSKVAFDNVLLIEDGGKITVGAPAIEGAQVTARIEKHLKGDKVIVFKKKRRKGYQKKNGFRAYLTELTIEGIAASGAKKGATPAKVSAPAPDPAKAAAKGEDLTMIEGIGPKIAELLISKGIASYADLASAEVDALRAILDEAGGVIKSKNPGTWPAQAKLASEGKFDELRKWQEELKDSK